MPPYTPLSTAFADPNSIMASQTVEETLQKLREIASPTYKYHSDLLHLALGAENLDFEHTEMLLNAAFYSAIELKNLEEQYNNLDHFNADNYNFSEALLYQINMAMSFSYSLVSIVERAIAVGQAITFDQYRSLLSKLYQSQAKSAYLAFENKFTLSEKEVKPWLETASLNREWEYAGEFAARLFMQEQNKNFPRLQELAKLLQPQSFHHFYSLALNGLNNLTHAQVVKIVSVCQQSQHEIASKAYALSSEKNSNHIEQLVSLIPQKKHQEAFLKKAFSYFKEYSFSDIKNLCPLAPSVCQELILTSDSQWTDPEIDDAIHLTQYIPAGKRSNWLSKIARYFETFKIQQAFAYINAAVNSSSLLAISIAPKILAFNAQAALKISEFYTYSEKDKWLIAASKNIKAATKIEAYHLISKAYEQGLTIGLSLIPKITAFSTTDALDLAQLFRYRARDKWLDEAANFFSSLTAKDLRNMIENSYEEGIKLALKNLDKISDLNHQNILLVAQGFNYSAKDKWLLQAIAKLDQIPQAWAHQLINSSYDKPAQVAILVAGKLGSLTPMQIIGIASKLSYSTKDYFILNALDQLTSLTQKDIARLAEAGYSKGSQIRKKAAHTLEAMERSDLNNP